MVESLAGFRDRFKGELIGPDDAEYDQARVVWNAMADRRPALVARCAGVDDVMPPSDSLAPRTSSSRCAGAATAWRDFRRATAAS